ncbi:MAG: hypothetical protein JJT94_12705 [Bernardetiaceae bacterium]|nr:hypothetical protein [Bernardetiaceae bacterium]
MDTEANAVLEFQNPSPYMRFRERLIKYTHASLIAIVLGVQVIGLLIVGVAFESWWLLFGAVFISIGFINVLFYMRWVRYYLQSVKIDNKHKTCYLCVYDYDEQKDFIIPLEALLVKVEKELVRHKELHYLTFYENGVVRCKQLIGVEHWTIEHCKPIYQLLKYPNKLKS